MFKVDLIVIVKKDTLNALLMGNVFQPFKKIPSAPMSTKVDVLVPLHLNVKMVGVERTPLNALLNVNVLQAI